MVSANAHHRCGAVNLYSKQSRFYLYLWLLVTKRQFCCCSSFICQKNDCENQYMNNNYRAEMGSLPLLTHTNIAKPLCKWAKYR